MRRVRERLKRRGQTLREAVIEGLRLTVLAEDPPRGRFELREAAFRGEVGFAPGFAADDLTVALRGDAEDRLVAEDGSEYEP